MLIGVTFENRHHVDETLERLESKNRADLNRLRRHRCVFAVARRIVLWAADFQRFWIDYFHRVLNNRSASPGSRPLFENAIAFYRILQAGNKTLLSLLKAEQCFVSGLEDAVEGNRVFKEWARSWARRTIIQNAVKVINPKSLEVRSPQKDSARNSKDATMPSQPIEISAVLRLEPFERFVYVMSVLEGYSDQHCSVLLGCARWEVSAARIRALQQIGNTVDSRTEQKANASSEVPIFHKASSSVLQSLGLHTWRLQHN